MKSKVGSESGSIMTRKVGSGSVMTRQLWSRSATLGLCHATSGADLIDWSRSTHFIFHPWRFWCGGWGGRGREWQWRWKCQVCNNSWGLNWGALVTFPFCSSGYIPVLVLNTIGAVTQINQATFFPFYPPIFLLAIKASISLLGHLAIRFLE